MMPAVPALPNESYWWLRPSRRLKPLWPTRPRPIAALAGVIRPAVRPCTTWASSTSQKACDRNRTTPPTASSASATATTARFDRTPSTIAPPGNWLAIPHTDPAVSISPICPWAQPFADR